MKHVIENEYFIKIRGLFAINKKNKRVKHIYSNSPELNINLGPESFTLAYKRDFLRTS